MQRFWEIAIAPILPIVQPKHIIEIGSDTGLNTIKILNYCVANDCHFTAIDPFPQFDADSLEKQSNGKFTMARELSLQALPKIKACDIALIDGDHNWYTVFNELKSIAEKNKAENHPFPICFFHDIGWPYGRRDMYYNPSNVPAEFVQPHAQMGIVPLQSELSPTSRFNAGFANALHEGGEKNGVLTAIEDFVQQSDLDLIFYPFNGLNGFGILMENTERNRTLYNPYLLQLQIAGMVEYERLMYQQR